MNDRARKEKGKAGRRIIWLAGAVILGIAVYTAGWVYAARWVDAETERAMAGATRDGANLLCENRRVAGYPFRLQLHCDGVHYSDRARSMSFTAGALRTAAQLYDPSFLVGEIDGEARLEMPGLPVTLLKWNVLRGSVRLAQPLPERISLEGTDLKAASEGGESEVFEAERVELHLRPDGADADFAASVRMLSLAQRFDGRGVLPPLDGMLDLSLDDGVSWISRFEGSLRESSGRIRTLRISAPPDRSIVAQGPFSVGSDGLLDAELDVVVADPAAIGALLAEIFPESANAIRQVTDGIAFFGNRPEFVVTISDGRIYVGPFEIGFVPALP